MSIIAPHFLNLSEKIEVGKVYEGLNPRRRSERRRNNSSVTSNAIDIHTRIEEMAEEEEVYALNPDAFENLEVTLQPEVERDLLKFRAQIQVALEEEIVMRYYLQTGVFEWSLPRDSTLAAAIEMLNSGEYKTILAGIN